MTQDRSSEADEPYLLTDAQSIARKEAENTLQQFDAAMTELQAWIGNPGYRLRPSTILKFNRIALEGLSKYAGTFRPGEIKISGSRHAPVSAEKVPELVEEFCEYINSNWDKSPLHLSAYALWRLNWIHPFVDGNGRTSRVVSYLILCAKLKYRLPGTHTIPEQISQAKQPYYQALESADAASQNGVVDVSVLEKLIDGHLASQLVEIHNDANSDGSLRREAKADYPEFEASGVRSIALSQNPMEAIGRHVEKYGATYTIIVTVVIAVIGFILAV
jgi:Fic family protein